MENRGEEPFLLYLSHFNVHAPYEARPEQIERFVKTIDADNEQRNPVMAAMLYAMDESLGRVLDKLDELGIAEETVVVFVSDNGGVHWDNLKGEYARRFPGPVTSNAPLRGGKATFYEGGVRVPMIVRQPGVTRPGARCETPVHVIDVVPTLLGAAGASLPQEKPIDGVDLAPLLGGAGEIDRDALYCHFPRSKTLANTVGGSFVRRGDYKLIRHWFGGEDGNHLHELFNLRVDIGEERNLAADMPGLAAEMDALLDGWLAETGALIPQRAPRGSTAGTKL